MYLIPIDKKGQEEYLTILLDDIRKGPFQIGHLETTFIYRVKRLEKMGYKEFVKPYKYAYERIQENKERKLWIWY